MVGAALASLSAVRFFLSVLLRGWRRQCDQDASLCVRPVSVRLRIEVNHQAQHNASSSTKRRCVSAASAWHDNNNHTCTH